METANLTAKEKKILKELKNCLKEFLGDRLTGLYIFGSKARGDDEESSDIDVAIIVGGLTRKLKNEILDKVAALEIKHLIPLSALVISEDSFVELKKRERRIALDIEREGISI